MYEFHRGTSLTGEDDFCYVRFEEGSWYKISGVPTTFTNGSWSSVNPDMAVIPMSESTTLQMSLDGTKIDGMDVTVRVSISSSLDMN